MSTKTWTASTKGADDVELGIPRTSPLVYHCTAPASGKAAGLVFLIPDFNDDVDGEAFISLREHLAQAYGLLAVTVEYHCYRSRLKDGARFDLSDEEFSTLSKLCMSHGAALLDRNAVVSALQQLPKAYEFEFRVTPPNGDYQDLGLTQALDHFMVLQDIVTTIGSAGVELGNALVMGHGYGGYLAHLMAKIAPNTIRAVFEIGGLTEAPRSYLFGSSFGDIAPYYYHIGNARVFPLVVSKWTNDKTSPRYFSPARRAIRDVASSGHGVTMRQGAQQPCRYHIGLVGQNKQEVVDKKRGQVEMLTRAGFDVTLKKYEVSDGATYEALIRDLFGEYYPKLAMGLCKLDYVCGTSIAYLCADTICSFEHGSWGCRMNVVPIPQSPPSKRQFSYF